MLEAGGGSCGSLVSRVTPHDSSLPAAVCILGEPCACVRGRAVYVCVCVDAVDAVDAVLLVWMPWESCYCCGYVRLQLKIEMAGYFKDAIITIELQ